RGPVQSSAREDVAHRHSNRISGVQRHDVTIEVNIACGSAAEIVVVAPLDRCDVIAHPGQRSGKYLARGMLTLLCAAVACGQAIREEGYQRDVQFARRRLRAAMRNCARLKVLAV